MNYTLRLVLIFCLLNLVSPSEMKAQYGTKTIEFIASYHEGDVYLRWIPLDDKTWKSSCSEGLKLERVRNTDNGPETAILADNLKPLSEQDWIDLFPGNETAEVARKLLYSDEANVVDPNDIQNIDDIWQANQQKESKHLFSMILAEEDVEVAKGLALAFKDESALPGMLYEYRLTLLSDENPQMVTFSVNTEEGNTLPKVQSITASSTVDNIFIEWNDKLTEGFYTTYVIERSEDGIAWGQCNDAPFMNILTTESEDQKAAYKDSVPSKDLEYFYRVKGKTPFGFYGPYSDVVKMKCAAPPLFINVDFNGYEITDDGIVLNWVSIDPIYNDSISGFNVYRAKEGGVKPEKLNTQLISKEERYFTDEEPLQGDTYYFLEATDPNDYSYRSLEMLVRIADLEAPEKVENFTYELSDYSTIDFKWGNSEAEDLLGYYMYVSTVRNGKYTKPEKNVITTSSYKYQITEKVEIDTLYFKVAASDKRGNISEESEILAIKRPDIFGPIAPVLSFANPTPEGIFFDCQYSPSQDVVKHELRRRKKEGGNTWETILSITPEEQATYSNISSNEYEGTYSFVDSSDLYKVVYSYWLFAIDGDGNESSSRIWDVLPYRSSVGGGVTNFKMDLVTLDNPPSSSLQKKIEILSKIYRNANSLAGSSNKYNIKLSWDAELDYSLSHFQIYRSIGDSGIAPVKSLTPEEGLGLEGDVDFNVDSGLQKFSFTEDDAMKNKRYTYYIVRVSKDGAESNKSSTLSKRVPND